MENRTGSFFSTFRPVLIFSQFCGLMPLRGIFGRKSEDLRCTWTSPVHFYGIGISAVAVFYNIVFTRENLKGSFSIDTFASTVFYTVCLLTTLIFLRVGQKMPEIAKHFSDIEKHMRNYKKPRRLGLKITSFILFFFILASIEHGTMIVLHIQRALDIARNGTNDFGHTFYIIYFPPVSQIVPYSGLTTIVLTWSNAICTFNWNFLDFFLIGISIEVSEKFDQITYKLKSLDCEKQNYAFWVKVYMDYGRIVLLIKKLDKILSSIIITSFFSNIYHLSLQLLRSLRIRGTLFHRLYFYFSLSYLILRLLTSLFSMANINEAGKKPADLLFLMENHCTASLRLLERILTDDIHFTGNRMFAINRSFVLSIIGTIITYQVVLLQFDSLIYVDAV